MSYLLALRILLSLTLIIGFTWRYTSALRHSAPPAKGRAGQLVITSALLYSGVIAASIEKASYLSIWWSTLVVIVSFMALEIGLSKIGKANLVHERT